MNIKTQWNYCPVVLYVDDLILKIFSYSILKNRKEIETKYTVSNKHWTPMYIEW